MSESGPFLYSGFNQGVFKSRSFVFSRIVLAAQLETLACLSRKFYYLSFLP